MEYKIYSAHTNGNGNDSMWSKPWFNIENVQHWDQEFSVLLRERGREKEKDIKQQEKTNASGIFSSCNTGIYLL